MQASIACPQNEHKQGCLSGIPVYINEPLSGSTLSHDI